MGIRSYDSIEEAISGCFGEDVIISDSTYVSGGDINNASCLCLSNKKKVFVKSNSISKKAFFDAEEEGLLAIDATGAIGIPKLLCKGVDREQGISFLMMEMIESQRGLRDTMTEFGHRLADMHNADTSCFVSDGRFGFDHDNFIGATKQINAPQNSWIDFFRQCRLEPQLRMASDHFDRSVIRDAVAFLDRLDDILTEPDHPSLLHGDLWSGNYIVDGNGRVLLIDPAAYVGNAEADIAMTELFGRFPDGFYRAYYEKNPLQDGYEDRRQIYNLYHLTNHLNLFGRGYLEPVIGIIRKFI